MKIIAIVALVILSACNSSGYSRSYIISDQLDTEVVSEPASKL